MTKGGYSRDLHASFLAESKTTRGGVFKHTARIQEGTIEAKVHESLDPKKKNKAGLIVREAFDTEDHPNSVPVAIVFDVTGSMGVVPKLLVEKLANLMGFLIKNGILADPQLLFAAVGDARGDKVPLQMGQFEASNVMDSALASIFLEGNGQSNYHESYDLAMYFLARLTNLDSLNKRGKKGYLIMIGDEKIYDTVRRADIKKYIGVDENEDISSETILRELEEKFEILWIFPNGSNYFGARGQQLGIHDQLKSLFGQRLVFLEDPALVCETIAKFIAMQEGLDEEEADQALRDIGADDGARKKVSTALAVVTAKSGALAKKAQVEGEIVLSGGGSQVQRL
jgi:hypothetical protein